MTIQLPCSSQKCSLNFEQHGVTNKALHLLKEVGEANEYVIDYLTDLKTIPERIFDYVEIGKDSGAIVYAGENIHLWADATSLFDAYFAL